MTVADWSALQDALDGEVVLPDAPGYDAARRPAIANFADVRPQAVVRCASERDAATALAFATAAGLPVAPRSGGHCFAGRSSTSEGLVLDVSPLHAVEYAEGAAVVGAGARLGDVYDALAPHGVTIPAGCGPDVGIAGLTLGGGLGILGRRHGLTSDALRAAQVTLPDGRSLTCDEEREPDLFWALRGAGGARFGVVTALAFATVAAPELMGFHLVWPAVAAPELIAAWQAWSPDGPDELAASLLVTAPADPATPVLAHVFGTMIAAEAETRAALQALLAVVGGAPEWRFCDALPFRATKRRLAEQPPAEEHPGHLTARSEFFRDPLPDAAIAALVAHVAEDRVAGESRDLDLSPWAGAYTRVPADATAFAHRDARFLLKHGAVAAPGALPAAADWVDRSWALVHPYGTGGAYPNFPEPGLDTWSRRYHGANLERLLDVKARYDPDGVLGPSGGSSGTPPDQTSSGAGGG